MKPPKETWRDRAPTIAIGVVLYGGIAAFIIALAVNAGMSSDDSDRQVQRQARPAVTPAPTRYKSEEERADEAAEDYWAEQAEREYEASMGDDQPEPASYRGP